MPRPFDPHDKIYVGARVVTVIQLYNPRDGIPVQPSSVNLHGRDPNGDIATTVEMTETPEAGTYAGEFVVDAAGPWKSVVEVSEPFESLFVFDFHVGASPLD